VRGEEFIKEQIRGEALRLSIFHFYLFTYMNPPLPLPGGDTMGIYKINLE
jgi:hypothetical protein